MARPRPTIIYSGVGGAGGGGGGGRGERDEGFFAGGGDCSVEGVVDRRGDGDGDRRGDGDVDRRGDVGTEAAREAADATRSLASRMATGSST